jgi:ABC-2 type transport system ATP-binding protein
MPTPPAIVNRQEAKDLHRIRTLPLESKPQMPSVLEFADISKEYRTWPARRRVRALHNFSLSVQRGEIFGFLGPNGAGKSTAIHLAMGFMHPSSGTGQMLGKSFGDAATRRRVGFLAENVALYNRQAKAAIRFYGGLNGMYGAPLDRATIAALKAVDLELESKRSVAQFSRGMVQRMGLAQALVNNPELLILDEPTSALDPAARVSVRELLLRSRDQGKTIFLSSHLLSEVELVCDRVAILSRGSIVKIGTLSSMLETTDQVEIVARLAGKLPFSSETVEGDRQRFTVSKKEQRDAIEQIWAGGGEVISVNPIRRSLEELFLELTSQNSDALEIPQPGARN